MHESFSKKCQKFKRTQAVINVCMKVLTKGDILGEYALLKVLQISLLIPKFALNFFADGVL
jgi:hypothetical protein